MLGEGLFGADTSARLSEARTRIPETLEPELRSSATPRDDNTAGDIGNDDVRRC
jgi:hypothetical protein